MMANKGLYKATTKSDWRLQAQVRKICVLTRRYVASLPKPPDYIFECHSIARAISLAVPELKLANGVHYGIEKIKRKGKKVWRFRACDHSWLVTPHGAIIDPYPIGYLTLDAVMVVTKGPYKMFGGAFYQQDENVVFKVSRKEIRKKSLALFKLIREAEKAETKSK